MNRYKFIKQSLLAGIGGILMPRAYVDTLEYATIYEQAEKYNWIEVAKHAAWQARDSQSGLVYKDKLWILGGWFSSYEAPPRDVWSSKNGKDWNMVNRAAAWKHSDLAMSFVLNDKMWIMGGWYNGRLKGHSASNKIWSSKDGISWELETGDAGWSPRLGGAVVAFKDNIWLLGGIENYYFGDNESLKNDVWYSFDGKEWNLATSDAGWSPRAYHQAAVLNGKIYIFGGGNYVPKYYATNDVWCSDDGIHWKRIGEAPWHPRLWFASATYRDCIWVMTGWSNNPSRNWSDVWYTKDGKNWIQFTSDAAWEARHAPAAFVFHDKIWIAGGNTYPLVNDVWSLKLPKSW